MILGIQILRVVTFPPFTFTVFFHQSSIVMNVFFVTIRVSKAGRFVEKPGVSGVESDAEAKPVLTHSFFIFSDNIPVRTHIDRIPGLVLAVPEVHVVVMISHCHEIPRTGSFVKFYDSFRIPFFSLPLVDYVLESEFGWMAILFDVFLVLPGAFLIHSACVPVAPLRLALRSPVCPHPEFRIPKPFGNLILLKRFPGGFEFPFFHFFSIFADFVNKIRVCDLSNRIAA